MGFITSVFKNLAGFFGVLLLALGVFACLFAGLEAGLAVISIGLDLMILGAILNPPGWAFKRARRGPKTMWLVFTLVGLIPPLGFIVALAWMIGGRAVERAWSSGDAGSYGNYQASMEAVRRTQRDNDAYHRGLEDGRRGW